MFWDLTRNERRIVVAFAAVVAVTRFATLSLGPWDWDEVLFCLAVGDYNVAIHQPHPAGFPLFILLGKLARFFADSDFHALQAVNVVASIFVFPVMFAAARAFRLDFVPSLAAALLFAFMPNIWFYGGTAFSDPLGMVLFLAAIAAYLLAGLSMRGYVIASVLMAAGILVRPQNAVVAVFPWTIATVQQLRARRFRAVIAGSLLLVLLVGIGYGAAALATGVDGYIASLRGHSNYVKNADTIASKERPPLLEVMRMQLDPFDSAKVALAMNLLALVAIVIGRRRVVAEVLLTFTPFFLFSALAANPAGTSRFSLNYLAGIVILAVEGTDALARRLPRARIAIHAVVVALLLGRLITWGWPAFQSPRTTEAPPTAAAKWLRDHVPPTSTIFVHGSANPWTTYFLPKHERLTVTSTAQILAHRGASNGWYIALSPPPDGAIGFLRPRNRTWNIVTKRAFEAFVQPTREVVGFVDGGWYNIEDDGQNTWRWSKKTSVMLFGASAEERELRLQFHVPVDVFRHPVHVAFAFNGQQLGTIVAKSENEVRYVVRPRADRVNQLRIELSHAFIPAQHGSHDNRELGLMLQGWSWRRTGAS
ncbi:MAG TPA: hypothetical protein VEK79_18230 [Thermoanaerobaculia bacterium]|nr:hypothetical protein [Thermoanaerobaculia bacterium]